MNSSGEIITLQFGNYTNHVGTHWWNIQEDQFNYDGSVVSEVNSDVLFREGQNARRETTFTPRLLLMDLKGSMTHFKQEGDLYPQDEALPTVEMWDPAKVETIRAEEVKKPEFQMDLDDLETDPEAKEYNFAETVKEWGDFMYSRYHPRTVNMLTDFSHEEGKTAFDTFALGAELWRQQEDFEDRIRNFMEECDFCQGFQVLFDVDDGFSGMASKCVSSLEDDFGKAVLTVPIFAPRLQSFQNCDSPMSDSIRLMNIALTYSSLSESASLILPVSTMKRGWRDLEDPVSLPNVSFRPQNLYQTSAVLATYLDTMSLRYRLRDPSSSSFLRAFCGDLSGHGRKLVSAGMSLPFPMNDEEDLIECLDRLEGGLSARLSPNSDPGTDYVVQSVSVRGIPAARLKKERGKDQKQEQMAAYRCSSVSEMIQLYYQCSFHNSLSHATSLEAPMKVRKPFPREIFGSTLTSEGWRSSFGVERSAEIESLPVMTLVQNSSKMGETLEGLHRDVKRVKFAKIHRFRESNMEQEEYSEALEQLLNFRECYDDGFQL